MDPAPNPELLRSLGRLARGLSSLFWGLPLALLLCAATAWTDWFHAFGILPALTTTGLLLFGLIQLGSFQKQERPWRSALDRASFFALINFMLSPFLFWWNRLPGHPFFTASIGLLALSALMFLFNLNHVLQRLGEMLPDEALRHETRQYAPLNRSLLVVLLWVAVIYVGLIQAQALPLGRAWVPVWLDQGGVWALIFLILLPLAMTMAIIWKMKEVILESVFGGK
jgi:hypothetical protein